MLQEFLDIYCKRKKLKKRKTPFNNHIHRVQNHAFDPTILNNGKKKLVVSIMITHPTVSNETLETVG